MSEPLFSEPVMLPYYVVDAWLDRVARGLADIPRWPLKSVRTVFSSGSMRHLLLDRKGHTINWFDVTAVSEDTTLLEAHVAPSLSPQDQAKAAAVLEIMWPPLMDAFRRGAIQSIRIDQILGPLRNIGISEADRSRGATPNSDNEWAREQIAAGRSREEVYQEWLTRRKIDISKPDAQRLARDAFRKAIKRTGRTDVK